MTAVEYIRQEFLEKITNENYKKSFDQIIEQAKEMEKQQIVEAYLKGYLEEIPNPSASHYYKDMAEQYYNETFKSE